MPQHGFLRNNAWKEVAGSRFDNDDGAGISMSIELKDVVNARGGTWDLDTKLDTKCIYSVIINGNSFTTTITIENTGTESFEFQVLLHNYFLVQDRMALDGEQCNVKGLEGYAVSDKVSGEDYVLGNDPVTIPPEIIIDRVYTPPQEDKLDLNLSIAAGPHNNLALVASGNVDGTKVPVSGVVWNPHKEKAKGMADFGDDQYMDMICVEPGLLSNVPPLEGGKAARFSQTVRVDE
jgi:glucose-6-phosphate 1-epimerase